MQFLSWTFIKGRLRAIASMMKDKTVSKRKKALVIFGLIYLVLPVDLQDKNIIEGVDYTVEHQNTGKDTKDTNTETTKDEE